jgi:hypothetical protein
MVWVFLVWLSLCWVQGIFNGLGILGMAVIMFGPRNI